MIFPPHDDMVSAFEQKEGPEMKSAVPLTLDFQTSRNRKNSVFKKVPNIIFCYNSSNQTKMLQSTILVDRNIKGEETKKVLK